MTKEERRFIRVIIQQLRLVASQLDEWQDADRTYTTTERSKDGPGWIDN